MYPSQIQGQKGVSSVSKTVADGAPSNWTPHRSIQWRVHGNSQFSMSVAHMSPKPFPHLSKIQKGISSARSNNTKSLKGVVLDWITPRDMLLVPHLFQNIKTNGGFHHPVTRAFLCPTGLDWKDIEWALLAFFFFDAHSWFSVHMKLGSGELIVCGDQ